ncbi:MAG: hypothetical protein IT311_09120, partial [Anaerolineales bacterium]|nr:hypothetical protein [Anaerolineales bacterium]
MIPYTSFLYFGISLYALLPAAFFGFFKRFWKAWLVLATLLMLVIQYSDLNRARGSALPVIFVVLGYAILQYLIALLFLKIRQRVVNHWALYGAISLSILPLAVEKISTLSQTHSLFVFLGISYITFRSVDVLLGVQDKLIKEIKPLQYL